jgi:hypothetical protein
MNLNGVIMSWSRACEKQPSQKEMRILPAWFEAPTNEEDGPKVHYPLNQTPRIQVLKLIGEGPLESRDKGILENQHEVESIDN